MKKFILIFLLLQVVTFGFAEDTQPQEPFDYTDPDTKVVYVCDPATGTATVKAGYDVWVGGNGEEYMVIDVITSSPEANGDIAIAEQLTIGGQVYCVTAIGNTAFRLNKNITSIIIPSSINSIGVFAFSGCNSLASVTSLIKEPFTYPEDCFSEETLGTATLRVPAGTRERYVAAGWNFKTIEEMEPEPPQNDYSFFYYYQGNKIPLTLNENMVVISIPKDCNDIIGRLLANIQTLAKIQDESFDIHVVLRSEYEKLTTLDFWAEDAKSMILTSSYYTENHEEVFATPYLNVQLKREEDIDLLNSYAEQYHLNIVKNMPSMPLWYILAVTPDSEKNNLACANELYESGAFAASIPDLATVLFQQLAYRPMVEDGKVWKVGLAGSGNPVQVIDYYYFDGDTIIDGRSCMQMMRQRYVNHDFENDDIQPSLSYEGAWYEEDKKVYAYDSINYQFKMMYDFSLDANETLLINNQSYVIGPRQTGSLKGFKGVYRDVVLRDGEDSIYSPAWLEGVGSIDCPTVNVYAGYVDPMHFLMACTVGDEVIYLNEDYEDGATPEVMGTRNRFDFTHTIKTKPKTPRMASAESGQTLYGEYSDLQLGINLDPLNDAYLVRITDETGEAVYEKNINAGNIVALSIDISTYAKGHYTVTVENSYESFTGEFETQNTGTSDAIRLINTEEITSNHIYNLQGQRIRSLQKGLNIVNGQKVYAK